MKNDDAAGNTEVKPDGTPEKTAKPNKEKKQKQPGAVRLPFLLELTYTVSTLILTFLAFAIVITSAFAGASLYTIVLRTAVAVVLVGGLLMLIASQVSSGLLFAAKIEQEEAEKKLEDEGKQPEREPVVPLMNKDAGQAEAA